MNIEFLHSIFIWIAIIGAGLSFLSALGTLYTGRIIDRQKETKIFSIQEELIAVQPRRLSKIERTKLKEKLTQFKGQNVIFVSKMMDNESADYAEQLESVFKDAGWNVGPMNRTLLDDLTGFLTAAVSSDNDAEKRLFAVRDAFLYAGINFRFTELRPNSTSIQSQSNTIYILVGRK